MLRNLLLSLSIISLTSACAIRGNGHGLAYVADGTMVVAGVALLAKTEPEPIDWLGDASAGEVVGQSERWSHELGAAMLITGLVAAGVNLYLNIDEEKPDPRGAQAAAFAGADLPPLPAGPRANPEAVRMTQQARRLAIALCGIWLLMLPVSWVHKGIYRGGEHDHSLDETTLILPGVVASIVMVVQYSLALAFALAGIVAGVQFRRALQDTFDALFILVAIGTGIAAGVGALEVAVVMSLFFCYATVYVVCFGDGLESDFVADRKEKKRRQKAEEADD